MLPLRALGESPSAPGPSGASGIPWLVAASLQPLPLSLHGLLLSACPLLWSHLRTFVLGFKAIQIIQDGPILSSLTELHLPSPFPKQGPIHRFWKFGLGQGAPFDSLKGFCENEAPLSWSAHGGSCKTARDTQLLAQSGEIMPPMPGDDAERLDVSLVADGNVPPWDTTWQFLSKLHIYFPCDPVIPFAGIYPRRMLKSLRYAGSLLHGTLRSPRHGSVGLRGQSAAALLLVCGPVSARLLGARLGDTGPPHQAPAWTPLTPDPCHPHLFASFQPGHKTIPRPKGALDVEEGT